MLRPSMPHPAVLADALETTTANDASELGARCMRLLMSVPIFA